MLNFSGWPTASNNIYMYKNPVLKGNFIKSLEVITSPDYHNNGSVYLL